MSQPIKRYEPSGIGYGGVEMCERDHGEWVSHSDYAALAGDRDKWVNLSVEHEKEVGELQGEVAHLKAMVSHLQARCRVLRRVGDEMSEALDDGEPNRLLDDWHFAKQGM